MKSHRVQRLSPAFSEAREATGLEPGNAPGRRVGLVRMTAMMLPLLGASGCSYFSNQVTPGRLQNRYTIILPGVEGLSFANPNIGQGLKNAGYDGAIEIDNWTTGSFLLFPIHLRDINRNRREAWRIAQKIIAYQDR